MGQDEDDEDRGEHRDGFLDSAEVQDDEENDGADIERESCRTGTTAGRKLKIASPQETMETVIVSI